MLEHALDARVPSWSNIPSHILQAELQRRGEDERPSCASANIGEYNTPIHVVALVIILVISTLGCAFPLISSRASKRACTHTLVFFSQHFGTGVLVATAFVHLVPTAFLSLTNACLPHFFNDGYPALAGVISMVAVLIVVGIEMFLRTRGVLHSHSHNTDEWEEPAVQSVQEAGHSERARREGDGPWPAAEPTTQRSQATETDKVHEAYVRNSQDSDIDLEDLDQRTALQGHAGTQTMFTVLTPEEEAKKKMLQCLLLEAGILFHSIFIGMALSVATGTPFIVLLVAISFHQLFEGMALGSRIAAIKFPRRSLKPWLMVMAYGLTTPIGQAIGLGVHTLYHPDSQAGLLMVGIMNAISAGLLLFAGLVQLLAEDFLSDGSYGILMGKKRVQAYVAVILGAALMALVGAWA